MEILVWNLDAASHPGSSRNSASQVERHAVKIGCFRGYEIDRTTIRDL